MRKVIITTALLALLAIPAFAAEEPKTEEQKTLYTVGLIMADQLKVLRLTPHEFEFVKQGMNDGTMAKQPLVDMKTYRKKAHKLAAARRDAQGKKVAATATEFLDNAVKEKGALKTASGAVYQSISEGSGASPTKEDTVTVNYRGTFVDGNEFDNSYERGKPVEYPLNSFIPCWKEGVGMMKPGGKARLVCPPETAYGNKASGIIPANATLAFEVELLAVKKLAKEGLAAK